MFRFAAGPLWGIVALATLLSGCGQRQPSYPTTRLQGSVTLDGTPLKKGTAQFRSQDLAHAPVVQAEIVDGRYVSPGVPLGKVLVVFQATRETGKTVILYEQPAPEVINIIPEQYRRGILVEVSADNPDKDFTLSTKSKP